MKELVAICTTWFTPSHADVLLTRWLDPHPGDEGRGWNAHGTRLAGVHVLQPCEEDDQAALKCAAHGVPLFGSIAEALCLGGDELAVDGILLIAEHGNFPLNEFRQKLYPRRELFDQIVGVMKRSGRVVPLFFDKHFSWDPAAILHVDRVRREMGIPLFAGSVLPFCPLESPFPATVTQSPETGVCVFHGGQEIYGFHALEFVQSIIESREGGETGIRELNVWKGADVFKVLESESELAELALRAVGTSMAEARQKIRMATTIPEGFYAKYSNSAPMEPCAFEICHNDGPRILYGMLPGAVGKLALALRGRSGATHASAAVLDGEDTFFGQFATLAGAIARLMSGGVAPHCVERNVFTSLAIAAVMRSLYGAHGDAESALAPARPYHYQP